MNKLTPIGLADLLRAGHVKRWHIIDTTRAQTLAEHNYGVATIALSLYNEISRQRGVSPSAGSVGILLAMALFHDAIEVRTGDIPTPGKELIKHFFGDGVFDEMEKSINGGIPLIDNIPLELMDELSDYERCINMADLIEAAVFVKEHGVGHYAMRVADERWDAMAEYATELQIETGLDWYKAVNAILSAVSYSL